MFRCKTTKWKEKNNQTKYHMGNENAKEIFLFVSFLFHFQNKIIKETFIVLMRVRVCCVGVLENENEKTIHQNEKTIKFH